MEMEEYVQLSAEHDMQVVSSRKRKRQVADSTGRKACKQASSTDCESPVDTNVYDPVRKDLKAAFERIANSNSSDLFDSTQSSSGFPVHIENNPSSNDM